MKLNDTFDGLTAAADRMKPDNIRDAAQNAFTIARAIRRELATFGAEPVKLYPSFDRGATVILARRDQRDDAGNEYFPFSTHLYLHKSRVIVSGVYDMDNAEGLESFYRRIGEL